MLNGKNLVKKKFSMNLSTTSFTPSLLMMTILNLKKVISSSAVQNLITCTNYCFFLIKAGKGNCTLLSD